MRTAHVHPRCGQPVVLNKSLTTVSKGWQRLARHLTPLHFGRAGFAQVTLGPSAILSGLYEVFGPDFPDVDASFTHA